MTKDVIELAREAGMNPNADKDAVNALGSSVPQHWLERFAALVAARERERCAQLCEEDQSEAMEWTGTSCPGNYFATAIRALNTEGEGNDKQPASD